MKAQILILTLFGLGSCVPATTTTNEANEAPNEILESASPAEVTEESTSGPGNSDFEIEQTNPRGNIIAPGAEVLFENDQGLPANNSSSLHLGETTIEILNPSQTQLPSDFGFKGQYAYLNQRGFINTIVFSASHDVASQEDIENPSCQTSSGSSSNCIADASKRSVQFMLDLCQQEQASNCSGIQVGTNYDLSSPAGDSPVYSIFLNYSPDGCRYETYMLPYSSDTRSGSITVLRNDPNATGDTGLEIQLTNVLLEKRDFTSNSVLDSIRINASLKAEYYNPGSCQ